MRRSRNGTLSARKRSTPSTSGSPAMACSSGARDGGLRVEVRAPARSRRTSRRAASARPSRSPSRGSCRSSRRSPPASRDSRQGPPPRHSSRRMAPVRLACASRPSMPSQPIDRPPVRLARPASTAGTRAASPNTISTAETQPEDRQPADRPCLAARGRCQQARDPADGPTPSERRLARVVGAATDRAQRADPGGLQGRRGGGHQGKGQPHAHRQCRVGPAECRHAGGVRRVQRRDGRRGERHRSPRQVPIRSASPRGTPTPPAPRPRRETGTALPTVSLPVREASRSHRAARSPTSQRCCRRERVRPAGRRRTTRPG